MRSIRTKPPKESTITTALSAPGESSTEVLKLERHGVDYIPASERHGHPKDLFTLWFGANAMAVTLATGAIAGTTGLGLLWDSVAITVGALIGTVFMAYHSAQGPRLGLPQMIQSRAQFGFYGANLPMIIVIAMYLGYYAGGAILGAQALNLISGMNVEAGVALLTALSLVLVLFGYNLMHRVGWIITPIYVVVFGLLTASLLGHWHTYAIGSTLASARFQLKPFFFVVSIIAAYYISYGPYVADYSRYLPVETSTAQTFWYTYAGTIASAIWIMVLGAAIQTAFAHDDAITGAAQVASAMNVWLQLITLITLVFGLANIGALNIYGATMSSLTIVTSIFRQLKVNRSQRTAFIVALSAAGGLIAGAASNDFLHAYENFIFFIVTFLIPWSAINLVDYYWIRKGRYVPTDLFTPHGRYSRFNAIGLAAYALGCLCQIPFISQEFYTGRIASRLGFDVAWIVGLIVPGSLYYLLTRKKAGYAESGAPLPESTRG
jgi:nucleobase:cation symporter-1, NCS1 family